MDMLSSASGYSAEVDLQLHLDSGECLEVRQVGGDSLILRHERELPPGPAELVIIVDGKRETRPIIVTRVEPGSRVVYFC